MKKYFLSLVAMAAMLFATSCQESLVEPQMEGPTTFTVQLPDGMGTKAYGDEASTKATINRLYVEVYSQDGGTLVYEPSSAISMDNATATVELNLVSTQKYDIIFWAQNESCTYDVSDLRSVKMNANHHNSETGAAFYAVLNDYTPVNGQQGVTLTRPFAQLNLATTTEVSYANSTNNNNKVTIESAKITVKGVAPSFDRIHDQTSGEGYAPSNEVTYTYENTDATTNSPKADGEIVVAGKTYQYVSMDYFAVPGGDQSTVQVTAEITVTDPNGVESTITRIIENVPVQLNYKTNIVGNLITSATDFIVTIDESWNTPNNDKEVEFREVATAQELEDAIEAGVDNITLTDDITLDQPLVFVAPSSQSPIARASTNETSFVLDLNGKNLKGSISVNGVVLIVNNGTIVSEKPEYSGIVSNGDLTLNNVNITSARHALRIESGKAVIDGGVYKVEPATGTSMTLHALNVGDDNTSAEVLIKNGEFIGPRGKNADSGSAVKVRDGSKVTIENGVFSGGKTETLKANQGDLVVKGGQFDQNPASWVAEGYKAVKAADEDNADNRETYVVIPAAENYNIVITDPTQLTKGVLDANENILLQLSAGEYTIDLYMSESFDANLTIVGTKGTKVKFANIQVRLALFKNFTIKNCEILRMPNKTWGMLVFGSGNKGDEGKYTIENCTFNGRGTQGIYINEEISGAEYNIINCTFNGEFGDQGAITIETNKTFNYTVNVIGCEFNDVPANHRIFLTTDEQGSPLSYDFTLKTDLKATTAYELEMFLNLSNQVNVARGNYEFPTSSIKEGQTIICEEGTVFTGNSKLNIKGAKVINATFSNPSGTAVDQTINGVFENCTFTGSNALRWCEAGETVEFINCVFDGSVYGVHFNGGANDVIFDNCVLSGFNTFGAAITSLKFDDCIFKSNGKSGYNGANLWCGATMTNCEFTFDGSAGTEWIDCMNADGTYKFDNCTINTIKYTSTNYTECDKIFSSNDEPVTITINGVQCEL